MQYKCILFRIKFMDSIDFYLIVCVSLFLSVYMYISTAVHTTCTALSLCVFRHLSYLPFVYRVRIVLASPQSTLPFILLCVIPIFGLTFRYLFLFFLSLLLLVRRSADGVYFHVALLLNWIDPNWLCLTIGMPIFYWLIMVRRENMVLNWYCGENWKNLYPD